MLRRVKDWHSPMSAWNLSMPNIFFILLRASRIPSVYNIIRSPFMKIDFIHLVFASGKNSNRPVV